MQILRTKNNRMAESGGLRTDKVGSWELSNLGAPASTAASIQWQCWPYDQFDRRDTKPVDTKTTSIQLGGDRRVSKTTHVEVNNFVLSRDARIVRWTAACNRVAGHLRGKLAQPAGIDATLAESRYPQCFAQPADE